MAVVNPTRLLCRLQGFYLVNGGEVAVCNGIGTRVCCHQLAVPLLHNLTPLLSFGPHLVLHVTNILLQQAAGEDHLVTDLRSSRGRVEAATERQE